MGREIRGTDQGCSVSDMLNISITSGWTTRPDNEVG